LRAEKQRAVLRFFICDVERGKYENFTFVFPSRGAKRVRNPYFLKNMENQEQNQGVQASKKKIWVVVSAAIVLVLIIGGIFVWENYLGADAQRRRQLRENYDKAEASMNAFEKAMREDTYGGKTPQETLDMFIDALKKGDTELASKYFMLDTNTQSPDYLTRRQWEEGLMNVQKDGKIYGIISNLENIKPQKSNTNYEAGFESLNKEGIVEILVEMNLNKYSQIWKIISM
jgi:hypothetical protein